MQSPTPADNSDRASTSLGAYRCTLCRSIVDIPADAAPDIAITTAHDATTLRVIVYNGHEVHGCDLRGTEPDLKI